MISEDAKKLIEANPVSLATCSFESPDVAVVADVKVLNKNQLLIGDNYLTTTMTNINKNNKVVLAVWNANWKEECFGYKLAGKAVYLTQGKYFEKAQEIHKGFPAKGAILVTVDSIKRIGD